MNTPFGAVAPQPQEEIKFLEKFEIDKVLKLAKRVKSTLSIPHHLKPKTKDELESHIESGGKILGLFDSNNVLIGSAVLIDPESTHFDVTEYSTPHLMGQKIIIQMFMVDPEKQRNGVSKKLMDAIQATCPDAHLVSKVAIDNAASLGVFSRKNGFEIIKTFKSPTEDGADYDACILCKPNRGLVPALACTATPV